MVGWINYAGAATAGVTASDGIRFGTSFLVWAWSVAGWLVEEIRETPNNKKTCP